MKRFLLDTNVVSEMRRSRPHGAVVAWLEGARLEQLFVSAVTMGELQAGIERARPQDPEKARAIEAWLERLPEVYAVLPMDTQCFREWARLMHGQPQQLEADGMLAATARVHGLVVATRNERDFTPFDVEIINPFASLR